MTCAEPRGKGRINTLPAFDSCSKQSPTHALDLGTLRGADQWPDLAITRLMHTRASA